MVADNALRRFQIADRIIGDAVPSLVIAEIGINHEGSLEKALQMIDDAAAVGCECVKFQCHIPEDEMIRNDVVPANADESIWNMMNRCSLSRRDEEIVKAKTEERGMIFLSTPFSRAAADRLAEMDVDAFKVGSGECNNLPLLDHIAGFGKPVILSTGMNDLVSVRRSVDRLSRHNIPVALMHCTSVYPTPHHLVRLGSITEMRKAFPECVIGLSDHTEDIYSCLGAVALGAGILERHFTSSRDWPGPDIPISMTPEELGRLIRGSRAIHQALGGSKTVLPEENATIRFAFASVVTIRPIAKGETLSSENIWVKRPGTGEIPASDYHRVIGRIAGRNLDVGEQVCWADVLENGIMQQESINT